MIDKQLVTQIVEDFLKEGECFLVEVKVSPSNEIAVDIDSDRDVDIDTCCALSQYVEAHLDRNVEDYELQVGSYGLTSPLRLPRQYRKFIGQEVEVLADGKKRTGVLTTAGEETFSVEVEEKDKETRKKVTRTYTWKYDEVKYTKYNLKFN
ncbi:MAG: ribosome assembly cofactor RimP [Paludibacteraceae bacterium]|nr:ribosome assembly cofactor RimP [Paludibacteraceae bacterium]